MHARPSYFDSSWFEEEHTSLRQPLRLPSVGHAPQFYQTSESLEFCATRAYASHPTLRRPTVPQPPSHDDRNGRPLHTSVSSHQVLYPCPQPKLRVGETSTSEPAHPGDTFGVHVGHNSRLSLQVPLPPGLGHEQWSYTELATFWTAPDLSEAHRVPSGLSGFLLATVDDSGSSRSPRLPAGFSEQVTSKTSSSVFSLSSLHFVGTLGRGGCAKVLLADFSVSGDAPTQVAVKVYGKKDMTRDDTDEVNSEVRILRAITKFQHESSAIGSAFLQGVHAAFQTEEHVFIVMDRHCASLSHPAVRRQLRLHPGSDSLNATMHILSKSTSLPIAFPSCSSLSTPYDEALNALRLLSAELLLGLLFLHAQGIVHQDIKPANVLLSTSGHAVITDFGSARRMPPSRISPFQGSEDWSPDFSSNSAWTLPGSRNSTASNIRPAHALYRKIVLCANDQISFTRRYAAPELLNAPPGMEGQDILIYDERVDFYSLGIMLRELAFEAVDEAFKADFGCSFGSCERWECASDGATKESRLESEVDGAFLHFIDQLVTDRPDERLCGVRAREQTFFDPLRELWNDVAALRYPPFTEVVWPDVEEDTRLDRRAYSEGDVDSLNGDDCVQSCLEELNDIPYCADGDHIIPYGTDMTDLERAVSTPPIATPPSAWASRTAAANSAEDLQTLYCDRLPHPPLSLLPTIPTLSMSSSELVKDVTDKAATVVMKDLDTVSGRKSGPLRRRQVVHDLREAFLAGGASFRGHPSAHSAPSPHRHHRSVSAATTTGRTKHLRRPLSTVDFEQQITIALLATMGTGSNPKGGGTASVASLHCNGPPGSARSMDAHCANNHDVQHSPRAPGAIAKRGKMQTLLRKVKCLMS